MYIVINLKRYLLCFANFTHAIISTQIQIQTQEYTNYQSINQSMAGYICYSFTPITAALTCKTNIDKILH